jgi:hypothetical protein
VTTKETGGNVTRPRAADDFATIRARMEELRRERAQVGDDEMDQTPSGPRLYHQRIKGETEHKGDRLLPRPVVRRFIG